MFVFLGTRAIIKKFKVALKAKHIFGKGRLFSI